MTQQAPTPQPEPASHGDAQPQQPGTDNQPDAQPQAREEPGEQTAAGQPGPDINPGRDNAQRLQSRAYESQFAMLPDTELEGTIERPGPAGAGLDEVSVPLVVVAAGCVAVLLGIFFYSFALLGIGLVVLLAGVVWNSASRRRRRRQA